MKTPKETKADYTKIKKFLKSLNDLEYGYLGLTIQMVDGLKNLIRTHKLTKEDVCKRFELKPSQYDNYIKGAYDYDMKDMALLNAAFMELEIEKLKTRVPNQIKSE